MSAVRPPAQTIRDELEPDILPRQRRALERLAARLDAERPAPAPALAERLAPVLRELDRRAGTIIRVPASALVGIGLAVLVLTALLAL